MWPALTTLAAAAAPSCDTPVGLTELTGLMHRAEAGFEQRDKPMVLSALADLGDQVPCLTSPLSSTLVARVFTLQGIGRFLEGEHAQAERWFRAAREVDADSRLPDGHLPAQHPLTELYDAATPTPMRDTVRLDRPRDGLVLVDGRPGRDAPRGRPWMFQRLDPAGAALHTQLYDDDTLPTYATPRGLRFTTGLGLWRYPNASNVHTFAALHVDALVPLSSAVDVEIGGVFGLHPDAVLPAARFGARAWLNRSRVSVFVGGALELSAHAGGQDGGLALKPAIGPHGGLRVDLGAVALEGALHPSFGAPHDSSTLRPAGRASVGLVVGRRDTPSSEQ